MSLAARVGGATDLFRRKPKCQEVVLARLQRHVQACASLTCVASAEHRTEDRRSCPVWIAVGQTHSRGDTIVFLFSRPILPVFVELQEAVYCVLPVVANIDIEVGRDKCVFKWSRAGKREIQVGSRLSGDCVVDGIADDGTVVEEIHEAFVRASQEGLLFYEEQRKNHKEAWLHRDAIPLTLAKLHRDEAYLSRGVHPRRQTRLRGNSTSTGCSSNVPAYLQSLTMLCLTWNVGATAPADTTSLAAILEDEPTVDILFLGLQEVCQLSTKRLLADGSEWRSWRSWAERVVREAYDGELELLHEAHLVGILSTVFVRRSYHGDIQHVRHCTVATGVGGVAGNKGAVCQRFEIGPVAVCFVNAHLAAGQANFIERCQNYHTIMQNATFAVPIDEEMDPDGGTSILSGTDMIAYHEIQDHDHIIWLGDFNSRLHWPGQSGGVPVDQAKQMIQQQRFGELLKLDQLNLMRREGMAFESFEEMPIRFTPSYKWKPNEDRLELGSQKHIPAWCDRILYRSVCRPALKADKYDCFAGLKQSDHRLVFSKFALPCDISRSVHRHRMAFSRKDASSFPCRKTVDLIAEPPTVSFDSFKSHKAAEMSVQISMIASSTESFSDLTGAVVSRFQIMLQLPSGELVPPGAVAEETSEYDSVESASSRSASALLLKWLSIKPLDGIIRDVKPISMTLSLNIREAIFVKDSCDARVVVRLYGGSGIHKEYPVIRLRAVFEPSVMRMPLQLLHAIGEPGIATGVAQTKLAGMEIPSFATSSGAEDPDDKPPGPRIPKEILKVLQWLLAQSRDCPPERFNWWPEADVVGKQVSEGEFGEMLKCVDENEPLPQGGRTLSARCGTYFILKWLDLLPQPILSESDISHFRSLLSRRWSISESRAGRWMFEPAARIAALWHTAMHTSRLGAAEAMLRLMHPQPRTVLIFVCTLFAQLMERHGSNDDIVLKLASSLAHEVVPTIRLQQLVQLLLRLCLQGLSGAQDRVGSASNAWPPILVKELEADFKEDILEGSDAVVGGFL
eukprot:TRINITY_DN20225_c0_g1_i1.p1 TRINITY_DN20225_c0_g1~~TRINITY_DN20225_c0_g1_i1.p1  ORF type:complete len:1021 (-),score=128.10 TRINITY_DN20225_c0_g1_i1:540-3602(-)